MKGSSLDYAVVHVWGGQPGRGPEVTTLRHCDSWQLIRNMFVLDGQVMLVTDRDKAKAIRDNGRKVARFLPTRIGKMMVAYVTWLLPFERMLRRKCRLPEPPGDLLEFMWRDGCGARLWETERLSGVLARVTQAGTGVRISVARYRPVAIEMGRRIRGLVMRQTEAQMEDGDRDEDDDVDIDPLTGEPIDCGGSWNIVWDLQSTHGTLVARQHYAVHIAYPGKLQPEMIATYREISRLWHQFLEHEAGPGRGEKKRRQGEAEALGAKTKRARVAVTDAQPEEDVERETMTGLRKLLGPEATWRSSKQEESMRTNMQLRNGQSSINVLPTGAGKSILFMLPAILRDGGTSIVVVPFVALAEDLVTRALDMGVDCVEFKTSLGAGRESMARAARLVAVSADVVSNGEFSAYADGLLSTGLLRRIFIDECHTAITDISYRRKLGELKGLHRYGCPVIMLTATMPVVLEDWFREALLAQEAVMVRDRTRKLNCRYRVEQIRPGKGAVENHTVRTVRRLTGRMVGNQKGVVYCRSKRQCEALAEEIGCDFHHSDLTEERRREARERWAGGQGHRWITATSGLGTGIDIAGIVAVIHAEQPYGLVDFVQQTGRGARRADEVVESIIVHDGRPPRVDRHRGFVEECNDGQMKTFMSTPGCRRAVISAFMDGVAGETCEQMAGAVACDRCSTARDASDGRMAGAERGGAIWKAFGKEEGARVRTLLRWLDEVAGECAICHVRRHYRCQDLVSVPDEPRHRKGEGRCMKIGDEEYVDVRKRITFGELSCCFVCKLPLDWCEERREGGRREFEEIQAVGCSVSYVRWQMRGAPEDERDETEHERADCKLIKQTDLNRWQAQLAFKDYECCWECGLPYDWCDRQRASGKRRFRNKVLPVVMLAQRGASKTVRRVVSEALGVETDNGKAYRDWVIRSRRMYGKAMSNGLAVWDAVVQHCAKKVGGRRIDDEPAPNTR
ncbi:hypothetical protein HIM_10606 [Hirsutella minnesotensis 3608]|uniref:DNA 3'-5' helicase n=1 Tax=Hirsutella minnesotensis 3608 TaxID=1043627 RepID=A0A0F7ZJV5_9HYPO|nr:hypothetical protein HIM_10606 [Hirsutella minnesotensis 3608]